MPSIKGRLPFRRCRTAAGVVAAVGAGVTRVKPGDRVATLFFQGWMGGEPTARLWLPRSAAALDGVAQEKVLLSARRASPKVPARLSDEEAACLPCAA